jgi:hypothetical protein
MQTIGLQASQKSEQEFLEIAKWTFSPNPYFALTVGTIRIDSVGKAIGTTSDSLKLIRQLDLNAPRMIEWRLLKLEFERLAEMVPELLNQLNRLPNDIPDLSKLRPKGNSRPNGIKLSWRIKIEAKAMHQTQI